MPPLSHRARTALGSALETALSRAGSAVDRGALRVMRRAWQRGGRLPDDARARMVAMAEHYAAAAGALFAPPEPRAARDVVARERPGRAGARAVIDLRYPSRYRPTLPSYRDEWARYGANLTAHARLYRGPGPAGSRPAVICLHGWGGGQVWLEERAFIVRYLIRIGLDPVLFQLPFHAERAPVLLPAARPTARRPLLGVGADRPTRSGALFPSANVVRTNEAFGQAIWDLRVLAAYLRERTAPAVGVIGMSLGAYTAALWAGLDELSFAGVFIPAVSISQLIWTHGAGSPARREAERAGISADLLDRVFHVHAPLSRPPRLPRERLFVAGARGDLITPPEQAEALWRHWGEPEMCWFGGGHLAQLARGDAFRALRRWLYSLPAPHRPCAEAPEAGGATPTSATR